MIDAVFPPKPQYAQVAAVLHQRIDAGTYPAGGRLPSEDALALAFGCSRVTVNRAVRVLQAAGIVEIHRGKGTLVRERHRLVWDAQARDVARGDTSRVSVASVGETEPPGRVAETLGLSGVEAAQLLRRRHIRYTGSQPCQVIDRYCPWSAVRPAVQRAAVLHQEVDGEVFEPGLEPVRFGEDTITARPCSEAEQRLLLLDPSQTVFDVRCVAVTAAGRPIEVTVHVMPGRLWELHYPS